VSAPVAEAPVSSKRGRRGRGEIVAPSSPSVAATPQKEVVEILRGTSEERKQFDKEKP
jgi:hypothetical protein